MDLELSICERAAASVVASLSGRKHVASDEQESDGATRPIKLAKMANLDDKPTGLVVSQIDHGAQALAPEGDIYDCDDEEKARALEPFPFFYYRDHSLDVDDDPLTPLTPPARVPNFPAKMHAILSRTDLADVVTWMPHGRSWRVLKPREFEIRVIPTYFDHQKFSSFIRQANGWGFRRITQGRDRNSYYHESFLRNMPYLCKQMRRPGVSKKASADPEHEPDFYEISEIFPVSAGTDDDDNILLPCTLQGGPKARMPVNCGSYRSAPKSSHLSAPPPQSFTGKQDTTKNNSEVEHAATAFFNSGHRAPSVANSLITAPISTLNAAPSTRPYGFSPCESESLASFHRALHLPDSRSSHREVGYGSNSVSYSNPVLSSLLPEKSPFLAASLLAKRQAASAHLPPSIYSMALNPPSDAASQFAAGFAAATALSSSHMRSVLTQALAASNAATALRVANYSRSASERISPSLPTRHFPFSHPNL